MGIISNIYNWEVVCDNDTIFSPWKVNWNFIFFICPGGCTKIGGLFGGTPPIFDPLPPKINKILKKQAKISYFCPKIIVIKGPNILSYLKAFATSFGEFVIQFVSYTAGVSAAPKKGGVWPRCRGEMNAVESRERASEARNFWNFGTQMVDSEGIFMP